jgi:hypothetical protein
LVREISNGIFRIIGNFTGRYSMSTFIGIHNHIVSNRRQAMRTVEFRIKMKGEVVDWVSQPVIDEINTGNVSLDEARSIAAERARVIFSLLNVVEVRWNFKTPIGLGQGHYIS